ncbi:MAG: RNA methyltransferase [Clostridiales bacterium]|nr:RNA methyltransferase [Clostridiales bacterium]
MITSTANKQLKYVSALMRRPKTRREEGLFVAEGVRMCAEIPDDRLAALYLSQSFSATPEGRRFAGRAERVEYVSDEVFRSLSDTQTPQGVLALVRQRSCVLADVSGPAADGGAPHLLILERLQDPGNLGTMIRAGEGAGLTGVVMDADTVDVYSPKVIRSTMGSVLRVPFVCVDDLGAALHTLKESGIRLFAAHLDGEKTYDREDYLGGVGFLIGNEANGLSDEIAAMADEKIRIPMAGQVESLNAAVAASVLMFETARQRRNDRERRRT